MPAPLSLSPAPRDLGQRTAPPRLATSLVPGSVAGLVTWLPLCEWTETMTTIKTTLGFSPSLSGSYSAGHNLHILNLIHQVWVPQGCIEQQCLFCSKCFFKISHPPSSLFSPCCIAFMHSQFPYAESCLVSELDSTLPAPCAGCRIKSTEREAATPLPSPSLGKEEWSKLWIYVSQTVMALSLLCAVSRVSVSAERVIRVAT